MKQYVVKGCSGAGRRGGMAKWIGLGLMVVGGLILIIAVPIKFWFALVGFVLMAAGFVLWIASA